MRRLKKIIARFNKANILIIGDLILDEYVWGDVQRISAEAPVPVVWADQRTYLPGGAANVASNIRSLAGKACLAGVVGKDEDKNILLAELKKRKISAAGIQIQPSRHTTLKTRIIAQNQQIVRIDWEHTEPLSAQFNQRITAFVDKNINKFDAIIIEDYGKGVVNIDLLERVISIAHAHNKIITIDPKEEHFTYYRSATAITPNRKELENAIRNIKIQDRANRFQLHNDKLVSREDIDIAARQVLTYLDLDSILVTLGEHGMQLFERSGRATYIPTVAKEVFDVSGAGDTVIAAFTLALASGASKIEAAHIANFAAGIVVGKVGTAVTNRKELLEAIDEK